MPAPRVIESRKCFSGRMSPSVSTVERGPVSLWDLTDKDTIVPGMGWRMPDAFATVEGVKQWREFLEPLSWGMWDAVTVWADWRRFKPGDTLNMAEFHRDYCGRWRDFIEYAHFTPGVKGEDYAVLSSRVLLRSVHIFKKHNNM